MYVLSNKNNRVFNNNLNTSSFIHFNTSKKKKSAEDYIELAIIHKNKKLIKKSIYFYEKALSLRIYNLGLKNVKTLVSIRRLAEAYLDNNMIIESMNYYGKLLEVNQDIYGKDSLEAASTYSALANIHFSEQNIEEAFSFYLKALKIREELLGVTHPLTANSMHELGYFYAASEEYGLALELFEKALDTRIELYRLSHPDTAKSYSSLAMCNYHLFNYNEASIYMVEAIRIKELIFPKNDERLVSSKKNLLEIKKKHTEVEKNTFIKSIFLWFKNF